MSDDWQIYDEMAAYGASPLDVMRQAQLDGLNKAQVLTIIADVFTDDDDEYAVRLIERTLNWQKYVRMVEDGATPEEISDQFGTDGFDPLAQIRILRQLFNLTVIEAVRVISDEFPGK